MTPPKPATDEAVFKAKANAIRPKIVGGLLNGLAAILPIYDPEGNGEDSRMAATVGVLRAIDKLFSPPGGAEAAYREMRKRAAGVNVENKPFILAVLRVVAEAPISKDGTKREWRGSATDLLAEASAKREWSFHPEPQRSRVAGGRNPGVEDPQHRAGRAYPARGRVHDR